MRTPPTPWAISHKDRVVRDADGNPVFAAMDVAGETDLQRVTTTRRILAAVNATTQFPVIELERLVRFDEVHELVLLWQKHLEARDSMTKAEAV